MENSDAIKNEKLKSDDISFSPTAPPPEPSVLSYQQQTTIQNVLIEIPVLFNPNPTVTNVFTPFGSKLTDEQIRSALIQYTKNSILASTNKAKIIKILNVEYSFAHIYELLNFYESREFKEKYTTYRRGRLDDQSLGRIPGLFEIVPRTRPTFFVNSAEKLYVPHSEKIKICHGCNGKGKVRRSSQVRNSDGSTRTSVRYVTCSNCGGNGQLKYYLECKIKWKPTTEFFISTEFKCIPEKKLRTASGTCIFNNQDSNVLHVNYTTDTSISEASKNLINKSHQIDRSNTRLIQQRQKISLVPLAACHYEYNSKLKTFWIIGDKMDVFAPSFPIDVSCSIM